jgi:hypothetical protein
MRAAAGLGALALWALCAGLAVAQTQRIAGEIVAVEGNALRLRPNDGDVKRLQLAQDVRVSMRAKADFSHIKPHDYVATTAVPQADGTLRAKEVRIFAESMRGSGEGHYPMQTPGDTMTNATVSRVSGGRNDTMTNATVASAATAGGERRMTLTFPGGEKTVVVPADVPVMRQEPGDRAQLVPGAHVIVTTRAAPDGGLLAERITVGKDGFVPPL